MDERSWPEDLKEGVRAACLPHRDLELFLQYVNGDLGHHLMVEMQNARSKENYDELSRLYDLAHEFRFGG